MTTKSCWGCSEPVDFAEGSLCVICRHDKAKVEAYCAVEPAGTLERHRTIVAILSDCDRDGRTEQLLADLEKQFPGFLAKLGWK